MIQKPPIIIGENISNIIMTLLIASAGCAFASIASEDYISIHENGKIKKYGIFEGKNGGSGCLGQCEIVPVSINYVNWDDSEECVENETYCKVFKSFPMITGICAVIAASLLTFTFPVLQQKLNKEVAAWVLMWFGFLTAIISLLTQLLLPVQYNKNLWDLIVKKDYKEPIQEVNWGEGFILTCVTIAFMGMAALLHGINNITTFTDFKNSEVSP